VTIDELLADKPADVRETAHALRELINEIFPNAEERVNPGWRNITYGHAAARSAQLFGISPQEDRVNLYVFHGALLEDPAQLMEGTGKITRHVKVRSPEHARRPELRELMQSEMTLQRNAEPTIKQGAPP
jgi:hypothetical protein